MVGRSREGEKRDGMGRGREGIEKGGEDEEGGGREGNVRWDEEIAPARCEERDCDLDE